MKLKTELSNCGPGDVMLHFNGDNMRDSCEYQLNHDAMYAHALVASIDEVGEMRYDADALSLGVQIFERADELMAEWLGEVGGGEG